MKKLKVKEDVYLGEYDVHVHPVLTYAEIQSIVDVVKKYDTWAERQLNLNMLLLFYTTDIGQEKIEELDTDLLYQSGLIDAVKAEVVNYWKINEALQYTESTQRALAQILKQLPEMIEPLKKVVEKHGAKK